MSDYLVFDTEAQAQAALETIYANMVGAIASPDVINVSTGQVVDKNDLTAGEAGKLDANQRHFPIFGVSALTGNKNTSEGYTTAWAQAQQTLQNKWVFSRPIDALMAGVANYTVSAYNPDWFPTQEMSK